MKRLLWIALLLICCSTLSVAQKFAFVDSEYILSRIPTYKSAQEQLDKVATQYETEISEKYKELDKLSQEFEVEKVLLTEEMKKKREAQMEDKEKGVKELQVKYFGKDGLLFKKREELVKPIQDQVFNAVKEVATEGGYAIIFDSAASTNMLFTNPRYDKSDEVLQKLGYSK